ncbi:MAG: peptide chain release factor N(5)-glutamine methyltransferase [Chloroflexi bacterium]|nr:peptide chain release factor N(5)-glutamine methyltransferase [Chloroflexota bacterium]
MNEEPRQRATTLSDALRLGRTHLASSRTESPGLDAEVLLRHVLGIDRTALFARLREPIVASAFGEYHRLLEERARGAPVAYLTGTREFMGLSFAVGSGVLIPRPETEVLVEWAIAWLGQRDRDQTTVVDVGTGSGAIAISIATAMGPDWPGHVLATDVSAQAISVATRNRNRLVAEHQVRLVQSSLLSWLDEPVDLVLANLPYLRADQIMDNPQLAAEPSLALDGGVDGLDLIRALLADAPRVVAPGGAIGLEIDPSQRDEVLKLARTAFPGSRLQVLRDLAGLDRHVTVELANPQPRS